MARTSFGCTRGGRGVTSPEVKTSGSAAGDGFDLSFVRSENPVVPYESVKVPFMTMGRFVSCFFFHIYAGACTFMYTAKARENDRIRVRRRRRRRYIGETFDIFTVHVHVTPRSIKREERRRETVFVLFRLRCAAVRSRDHQSPKTVRPFRSAGQNSAFRNERTER